MTIESLYPGTVPEYEERETARWAGYTFMEWLRVPVGERTRTVAHRRMQFVIEEHVHEAQERDARLRSMRRQRKPYPSG